MCFTRIKQHRDGSCAEAEMSLRKCKKFSYKFPVICVIICFTDSQMNGRDGSSSGQQNRTEFNTNVNYTNGREVNFTNDRDVPIGYEGTLRGNRNDTVWNGCNIIVRTTKSNCSNYNGYCAFKTEVDEHILSIELITPNLTESCYKFEVEDTGIRGASFCNGLYRVTTCQGCSKQRVYWKNVSPLLPYYNYRQYYSRRKNVVYRLPSSCEANVNYGEDQVGFWVTEECHDAIPYHCNDQDISSDENLPKVYKPGSSPQVCQIYETIVECKLGTCPILDVQNIKSTLVYIARMSDNSLDDNCLTSLSNPVENVITCSHLSEPLRILTCDACVWSTITCEKNTIKDKMYCSNSTDDLIHYDFEESPECRKKDTINRDENGVYIQASCMSVEVKLLKCGDKAQVNDSYTTVSASPDTTITAADNFSSTSKIDHESSKSTEEPTISRVSIQIPMSSTVSARSVYKLNSSNYNWCSLCFLECPLSISTNFSVENITAELLIDSSATAKSKRKKISVPDYRPSAVTIGSFGILCIVLVVAIILSTDCIRAVIKVKKMIKKKRKLKAASSCSRRVKKKF